MLHTLTGHTVISSKVILFTNLLFELHTVSIISAKIFLFLLTLLQVQTIQVFDTRYVANVLLTSHSIHQNITLIQHVVRT